jgi:hypothetical protein
MQSKKRKTKAQNLKLRKCLYMEVCLIKWKKKTQNHPPICHSRESGNPEKKYRQWK